MAVACRLIASHAGNDDLRTAGPAEDRVRLYRADRHAQVAFGQNLIDEHRRHVLAVTGNLHERVRIVKGMVDHVVLLTDSLAAELVDLLIVQPAVRAEGNEDRDLRTGRVALDPLKQDRQHPLRLHRAREIAHQNAHVFLSRAQCVERLRADGVIQLLVDARGQIRGRVNVLRAQHTDQVFLWNIDLPVFLVVRNFYFHRPCSFPAHMRKTYLFG